MVRFSGDRGLVVAGDNARVVYGANTRELSAASHQVRQNPDEVHVAYGIRLNGAVAVGGTLVRLLQGSEKPTDMVSQGCTVSQLLPEMERIE